MKHTLTRFFSDHYSLITLSLLSIFLLTFIGCADQNINTKPPKAAASKFGYGGTNADTPFVTDGSTNTSAGAPLPNPATNSMPVNPFIAPTPQPVALVHDLPYGTPVPGKPGFVTSPHSPNAGYVDVRGFPPGTEVKDPYSGKVFLVP